MLFVVVFLLSIYLSLLFDARYTLSVKVKSLPGKIKIHMLQHVNINHTHVYVEKIIMAHLDRVGVQSC